MMQQEKERGHARRIQMFGRKINGIRPTPQVRMLSNANANYNVDPAWYRVMPIRCLMCYIYLNHHTLISYTRCHRST
jgi:hypothetical protein